MTDIDRTEGADGHRRKLSEVTLMDSVDWVMKAERLSR